MMLLNTVDHLVPRSLKITPITAIHHTDITSISMT